MIFIDPLESVEFCLTRNNFYEKLSLALGTQTYINGKRLKLPWQLQVNQISPDSPNLVYSCMKGASVDFPVLVKTNESNITEKAHFMCVVFNFEGIKSALSLYSEKVIVQEFVNHDRTVYKVYVIGEYFSYYHRVSCNNIENPGANMTAFESDKAWPPELKGHSEPIVQELDEQVVKYLVDTIKNWSSMQLFGFDILVQSRTGDYVLVDLNSFPGYKNFQKYGNYIDQLVASSLS